MGERAKRFVVQSVVVLVVSLVITIPVIIGVRASAKHEVERGRGFALVCLAGDHDCVRACAARFKNTPLSRQSCLDEVVLGSPND